MPQPTRRSILQGLGISGLLTVMPNPSRSQRRGSRKMLLYTGTYTNGKSEGIYIFRFDSESGAIDRVGVASGISNPSFLTLDSRGQYLYAVNEVGEYQGKKTGYVTSFKVDAATGQLTKLNEQESKGTSPCHISVDPANKFVLIANYSSGSIAVLPIKADGSLGEAVETIQHKGSGANKQRQEGPHAHSVTLNSNGRFAFAADLGLDRVMIYRLDGATGKLTANDPPFAQTHPGAGPRHFAIHPKKTFAYVINELDSTITAFTLDDAKGTLKEIETKSTLPGDFRGQSFCADVHVHPSGRFVYGSNRGHDSIAIFRVDERSGKIEPVGYESTRGRTPRNFLIDPDGNFLLAANQATDTIAVFKIDPKTGTLRFLDRLIDVPAPVCLKLI